MSPQPVTQDTPLPVNPAYTFPRPTVAHCHTTEVSSVSLHKVVPLLFLPGIPDKREVTVTDSLALTTQEEIAPAFLIWLVFAYLHSVTNPLILLMSRSKMMRLRPQIVPCGLDSLRLLGRSAWSVGFQAEHCPGGGPGRAWQDLQHLLSETRGAPGFF